MNKVKRQLVNKKVLVVEDDLWMRPLIARALNSAIPGVIIDWVETVEEGRDRIQLSNYTMIVSDIYLKPNRQTGMDLWYHCKEEHPHIPILLTSSTPVEVFKKRMGMYNPRYLSKPFRVEQLARTVENLISGIQPMTVTLQ